MEDSMKLLGKYPVNSSAQIKTACAYFDMYEKNFSLTDRIEYAQGLANVMLQNGLEPTEKIASYVGVPRNSIAPGMQMRNYLSGGRTNAAVDEIVKIASREDVDPYRVVSLIENLDKAYQLDKCYGRMPDPFHTVFEKVADIVGNETWEGPSDTMSQRKLEEWVKNPSAKSILEQTFHIDLVAELIRNPWTIFSSLPDPQKTVISRLVNDNVIDNLQSRGRSLYDYDGALEKEQLYESPTQALERLTKGQASPKMGRE